MEQLPPARAKSVVRELGWCDGGLYLVSRMLERVTQGRVRLLKYYFVAQPVRLRPSAASGERDNLVIVKVDATHPIVLRLPRPPEVIQKRFRDGAHCFVALRAEEFAGFLWLQHGRYDEDEVRCIYYPLPADRAVWDYDVYVDPGFRLTRTFMRLWDAAHGYLSGEGYRWTMSRISAFNKHSLSSHQRLGAVFLGSGLFLVIARVQVSFFTALPFVHVSLGGNSAPELKLRVSGGG